MTQRSQEGGASREGGRQTTFCSDNMIVVAWCLWKSCFLIWYYKLILAAMAEFLRHEKDIYHTKVLRYISQSQDHHTTEKKPFQ